ncbi:RNA polymerase II subunit A C-terminal domain phosphatase isoform X1 [Mustela nigripes]|uniref:RNA polymerase II subunit A C-terminal domain phosphatase isoform X1 n=1 Tax=Mustela nigripes TaxID=77151 RepID=UPI00281574CA|nr:RNA polymerase II subunit A C-terminal domain phosphatase isoform X1 [Mustela nigripes]
MEAPPAGRVPAEGAPPPAVAEVRCPGPGPLRLLEWRVAAGAAVRIGSVLAVCEAAASAQPAGPARAGSGSGSASASGGCVRAERRLRSERAGVVRELCAQPGQVVAPGSVLLQLEGCSHPVVMKGLCAECGQDLTQLRSKNGGQQVPLSTATVSMVHSVPELMVSSEQAAKLAREDQERLHRNRKLVLMVDLDQTLIHTTEQHCQQMSNKGIFHFQLGRGEPMLHTRVRPHCREFLEKIARLYELHVFTFGSRLYAHTIAGFLDPEKKLFSHRILSRDECIDPFSKTGNLRNLFPCGDSMVCIIDDREDVWKFAPNLITVKKYVYFQGIGDINAPSGSRESQARRKVNPSPRGADVPEQALSVRETEGRPGSGVEQSNGLGKPTRELNGSASARGDWPLPGQEEERGSRPIARGPLTDGKGPPVCAPQPDRTLLEKRAAQGTAGGDLDFDLSSDSESDAQSLSDGESGEKRSLERPQGAHGAGKVVQRGGPPGPGGERPCGEPAPGLHPDVQEEGERDGLCGLGGGSADRKEAETESQNSEQSGVTAGESLDQSVEEEDEDEDDGDGDDHLVHLEDILARVHSDYYARYDRHLLGDSPEAPDIRKIVPELKSRVLADVVIIFSGLHPTNFPVEKTREHYHATALGAKVLTQLALDPGSPNRATHLIAARAGTEKVRQAQECGQLHVVNPDWLWSCLERWDRVEEQLFPLREDYGRVQREDGPAAFPDRQGAPPAALFHPTPVHPRAQAGPDVRIYDANTGKLIRKGAAGPGPPGSLAVHAEHSSFRWMTSWERGVTTVTLRRSGRRRSSRSSPRPGSPRPRWRPRHVGRGPAQAAGGPGATSVNCPRRTSAACPAARPAGSPAGRTRKAAARRQTRWRQHWRPSSATSCDLWGTGQACTPSPEGSSSVGPWMFSLLQKDVHIGGAPHTETHNFAEIGVFRGFTMESLLF